MASLEARQQLLSSPTDGEVRAYAALVLQQWLRRGRRLRRLQAVLAAERSGLQTVLARLIGAAPDSLAAASASLTDPVFSEAMATLLSALPVDPGLRKKNALARSVRFISSALLVRWRASEVLTVPQSGSIDTFVEDTSATARQCRNAANMVCSGLSSLISAVLEDQPLRVFRTRLVGYRFAVRYFVEAMAAWRALDAELMASALQTTFVEVYSVLLSLENSFAMGTIEQEEFESNKLLALEQFSRIEQELTQLLGHRAKGVIEELKAFCESMHVRGDLSSDAAIKLRKDDAVQVVDEVTAPPMLMEEVYVIADKYADFQFTDSESQLIQSLLGVTEMPLDGIIYELCVSDKFVFRQESECPEFKLFEYVYDEGKDQDVKQFLRKRLLQVLGDRLISSLSPSSVDENMQVAGLCFHVSDILMYVS